MRPYLTLIVICTVLAFGVPLAVAFLDSPPRMEVDFSSIQKMAADPVHATKIKYLRHEKEGDQHWLIGEFTEPLSSWPPSVSEPGADYRFRDGPILRFKASRTPSKFEPPIEIKLPNGKGVIYP